MSKGEEEDIGAEIFEDIMAKSFTKSKRSQTTNEIKFKISLSHNIFEVQRQKEHLKNREQRHIPFKGSPVGLTVDFSTQTIKTRGQLNDNFKVLNKIILPT